MRGRRRLAPTPYRTGPRWGRVGSVLDGGQAHTPRGGRAMSDDQVTGGDAPPAATPRPLSFEEEERALHAGQNWKLPAILGLLGVLIVGGIVVFVMSGSEKEEIDTCTGQLNRMHLEH